jgi:flagellum-specific peptidoglycan hydrolase FlgJ
MALPNSEKITSQIAILPDAALKQMAMMHKNDPYVLPLIISEDGRRKQMRQAAQAQMSRPQPKVVDAAIAGMDAQPVMTEYGGPLQTGYGGRVQTELPEDQGIARIPTPNMQGMANGGIAGYEDDEEGMATGGMGGMFNFAQQSEPVVRMAAGGVPGYSKGGTTDKQAFAMQYKDLAEKVGQELGVDPGIIISQWGLETAWGKKPVGQYNLGNIKDVTGKGPVAYDKLEKSKASYKSYESPEAFAADYTALIKRNFPKAVGSGSDVGAFTAGLQSGTKGAYATDPNYRKSLASTFNALSNVIPSAQAGEPPRPAAPDLVSQIPGSKVAPPAPGEKERYITGNQGVIGTGETALQYLTGAAAMPLAGAYTALGQIPNVFSGKGADRAEMEKLFRERSGAMTYEPRTEGGRTVSEGFGKTLEDLKIPAYLARIGAGTPKGPAARPSAEGIAGIAEQMKQVAAEKKAAVSTPRLEPPRTEKPRMVVDSEGRAMPEDSRTRVANAFDDLNTAEKAARDAAAYEKAAIEAKKSPDLSKYAGVMDEAQTEAARARGISALASMTPSSIEAQKSAANADAALQTENQSAAETARLLRQNELPETPKPSDVITAAKDAVPAKERKGFGNDDLLMLGLSLLANKSPNFMTALGEAGMQTLGAKKEREKAETDLEYKDIMKKYYGSLGAKAEADAKSVEAGGKFDVQRTQLALNNTERAYEKWLATPEGATASADARSAELRRLAGVYYPLAGAELPSTMGASAPSAGFKVLGSRPQ